MDKRKQVIESKVEEYINLFEQDKAPSVDEFIKQYPELESDLQPRLESVRLLIEAGKEIPEMPEEMKQRLHALFWKKINESEKVVSKRNRED